MRTLIHVLVIIAMAGLLTGCCDKCTGKKCCAMQKQCADKKPCCASNKPCIKNKPCPKMEGKAPCTAAPAEANKPAMMPTQAPVAAPAEEKPAAEAAAAPAKAKGKLIVVTNEANYDLDKDVLNFIATRGITVERISPADFEKNKGEKSILILGGPNDGDGLGDIVKQALTADEVGFASQTGNKNLYLKPNKWSEGQNVLVIAGYDPDATFRELVNGKDKWWGYISSWFNIELSHDEVYGY